MNEAEDLIEKPLFPAECPSCGRVLCHAPAHSSVFCHDCRLWIDVEPAATSSGAGDRGEKSLGLLRR
ncbi:MAG: hypothetical protein AB1656_16970 [Candidatus Omnitrophota bacterium]